MKRTPPPLVHFSNKLAYCRDHQENMAYQRRIQDWHTRRAPPALKFFFVNYDYITRIYFDFSQHTMFTIHVSILFTTLTTNT